MKGKRTLTMNWDGLGDGDDDDENRFFETHDRISSAVSVDLASSSDEEDFNDSRMSFESSVSSIQSSKLRNLTASTDYDIWMGTPRSINERRKRLFQGMGLAGDKKGVLSFKSDVVSNGHVVSNSLGSGDVGETESETTNSPIIPDEPKQEPSQSSPSPSPIVLVRSRSEGDIENESLSITRQRKEELIGRISKQRITRTYSMILAPAVARICPYIESIREAGPSNSIRHATALSSVLSKRFGAFFLIKNLDTGKEFIVSEYDEDGMWNRLSDLQTGKKLTLDEFEKCVGYSPLVKELMRRENVTRTTEMDRKVSMNSYFSKSLRMSKRRGAALLKNIKDVANSMSGRIGEKDQSVPPQIPPPITDQKSGKNSSSDWIKVRQSGKSCKELSALHLCQEIQAHEGSIWAIRFSQDAKFLASAGEDRIIHVWEVQECEITSLRPEEGCLVSLNPSLSANSPDMPGEVTPLPSEKKRRGKPSSRKWNSIPDYVSVPETVFSLLEKPVCSFTGHLDDVLDLSWSKSQLLLSSSMDKTVRLWDLESKSCLKLFAHNDYVTCIQFNPADDNYFISGSLDAKVRIWSIPDRQVVDWIEIHEMVTAASYTPDGQGALIGSHKGVIRTYSTADCKLDQISQIDIQNKKKSQAKKITGFQFAPGNPSEVLVTSADSRIRILGGSDIIHKFRGFRNTSSQIAASFSQDGKHIVSASEDSQVYVWKREESRNAGSGKIKSTVITTQSHEHFQCKDVSVAIPWPGTIKGEPPPIPVHSKRHSKRIPTHPPSALGSPTQENNSSASSSKRHLPPLPKKNTNTNTNTNILESASSTPPTEEELSLVSHSENEIGESFNSDSNSMRYGDSAAISSIANASSSSWSSSWSWFDAGNNHVSHTVQTTAWGLVIVTAGLGGEIKAYQNFGVPRKFGR